MRKIEVVIPDPSMRLESSGIPSGRIEGAGRSWLASPVGASIWMRRVELDAGTKILWSADHGDEAVFVQGGELAIGGRSCPTGGALVIEANAAPEVTAVAPTRLLQMGARSQGPAADRSSEADGSEPVVHVVGPRGIFEAIEPGRETRFFADASCPGCRVWLLYTARDFAYESPVHSHSQDELIHVVRGEISIGSLRVHSGSTVFIRSGQPYQVRAGDEGFAFLNYRRDASQMTIRSTGEKILETGIANGMKRVSDLRSWRAPGASIPGPRRPSPSLRTLRR